MPVKRKAKRRPTKGVLKNYEKLGIKTPKRNTQLRDETFALIESLIETFIKKGDENELLTLHDLEELIIYICTNCPHWLVAKLVGLSIDTIRAEKDIPKHKGGRVDIGEWIISLRKGGVYGATKEQQSLKKLENENKILEQKYKKMVNDSIDKSEVTNIASTQASELNHFLTVGWKKNLETITKDLGLKISEKPLVEDVFDRFVKQAMDAFAKSGKDYDE
jgi:hypothetical protein